MVVAPLGAAPGAYVLLGAARVPVEDCDSH